MSKLRNESNIIIKLLKILEDDPQLFLVKIQYKYV